MEKKNIWHPVSEKPTKDGEILFVKKESYDFGERFGKGSYLKTRVSNKSLLNVEKHFDIWCYLEDILPESFLD